MEEPSELLRQAEEKDLLADRFDGYAKNLETVLDHVKTVTAVDGPIWAGPAAQRFDNDIVQRRLDVARLTERCRETALNLRRSAARLREQARHSRASM